MHSNASMADLDNTMHDNDVSPTGGRDRKILTITGADRPGLISAVSREIARAGADVEDVSMTRLSGNFAMIMLARGGDEARLRAGLDVAAQEMALHVHFEPAVEREDDPNPNVYVSAAGPNRIGIVAAISDVLAKHDVNITEMATRLLDKTQVPVYLVRIEAVVNENLDIISQELAQAGEKLGIEVRLEPIEGAEL